MVAETFNNTPLSADVTNSATDPNHIEIKTLIQFLDTRPEVTAKFDKEFADALNTGWELLNLQITSSRLGTFTQHTRFVTLQMLVEPETPSEPEKKVEAVVEALIDEVKAEPELVPVGADFVNTEAMEPITIPVNSRAVKSVSGVIIDGNGVDMTEMERKPLDEVTFVEALVSGKYSEAEVRLIGDREAMDAGLKLVRESQQNRAGQTWDSFVMRLPQAAQ